MNGREHLSVEAMQSRIEELEAERNALVVQRERMWKTVGVLNHIILEITDTLIRDGRFPNAVPAILEERAAALAPLGLK